MSDPSDLLLKWCDCFKRGNDFDAWGQFVEASEQYNRLGKLSNFITYCLSFIYGGFVYPL